ncbi:MAG: vWA domain-containing protein [Acidobacteriota bacterium]
MKKIAVLALTLGCLMTGLWAQQGKHIRVILDTSKSMLSNDKPRLAPLSTLLLHDLAQPNPTRNESFEVLTFHPTNKWEKPSDPVPTATGERLRLGQDRSQLASRLRNQPYDANWTYFYPGLRQAIEDLEGIEGADAVRVIVVVTDGLPEEPTREEELRRIVSELKGRMEQARIQLYILAFGPAVTRDPGFFRQILPSSGGELFLDRTGSGLLENMAEIFSRSFGYTVQIPPGRTFPRVSGLDLAEGKTPNRVAALMFWNRTTPPSLRLDPPASGAVVNAPDRPTGSEAAASYALWWVLSPQTGLYPLRSSSEGATVALLRPSTIKMSVQPPAAPAQAQIFQTMAQVELPLEVVLQPQAGATGDPGEFEVTFQAFGERASQPGERYAWYEEKGGPPAGSSRVESGLGRIYPVFPHFRQPQEGREYYVGNLRLEARQQSVLVSSMVHPVEVYPYVSISPQPRQKDALAPGGGANVLGRRERGCAEFSLQLRGDDSRLPHPGNPHYFLRAVVKNPLQGPLQGATVTLDGLPLRVEGPPGKRPGDWFEGKIRLSRDKLLGQHTACVRIGNPTQHSDQPAAIEVAFTLQESPYHQFDVIQPFFLLARVAPPPPIQALIRWLPWLVLLLILLALWYGRDRPGVPGDLGFALGSAQSQSGLVPRRLGPASLTSRLLGLTGERPVYAEGDRSLLGWVRPEDEYLYFFRPAQGVQLHGGSEGEKVSFRGKLALLAVAKTYLVKTSQQDFLFRLEFRS